jgi:hypothetical protein
VNAVYECKIKLQLINHYHALLASHTKRTLLATSRAGYLKGYPGLTQAAIDKFILFKDCTDMGHLQNVPTGKGSTTT